MLNCYLNINFSEQNEILKNPKDTIDNLRAQPLLSGDVAYPLCEWLMKTPIYGCIKQHWEKVQQEAFIFS